MIRTPEHQPISNLDEQKEIHKFVFGDDGSKETEDRAKFVKSFLDQYYNSAHSCDSTRACNDTNCTDSAKPLLQGGELCTTTQSCKNAPNSISTEHPSTYGGDTATDENDRHNRIFDLKANLAEKIGKIYKGNTETQVHSTSSANDEMASLPQHLQFFVDNVNESLHTLGTSDLTKEELMLLLATAPLPEMGQGLAAEGASRPRSRSSGDVLDMNAVNTGTTCTLRQSASAKFITHRTSQKEKNNIIEAIDEDSCVMRQSSSDRTLSSHVAEGMHNYYSGQNDDNNNGIGALAALRRYHSTRELKSGAIDTEDDAKATPKKRISSFFSKKMVSLTNIFEALEPEDIVGDRAVTKSKSFNFGMGRSGSSTPWSGLTTPNKSGSATPSGSITPRSGTATPLEEDAPLRQKLELVEIALCEQVVARTAAEQKVAQLEELVFKLNANLEREKGQKDTVAAINKQMGVELRFLRARNSRTMADRQQWEDALVGETKKRRVLEEQIQMLLKNLKDMHASNSVNESLPSSNKVQEAIFSQQREEVLLAVVESLRTQLATAEAEIDKARNEWEEEKASYQASHDLLNFQIDQLSLTRSSLPTEKADAELEEKVEAAINAHTARNPKLQNSSLSVNEPIEPVILSSEQKAPCNKSVSERMKLFFLSPSWWPKFDFIKEKQPRPPVLLMQVAWWVAELREYVDTNDLSLRFLSHNNQFCNCNDCVNHISSYAISN